MLMKSTLLSCDVHSAETHHLMICVKVRPVYGSRLIFFYHFRNIFSSAMVCLHLTGRMTAHFCFCLLAAFTASAFRNAAVVFLFLFCLCLALMHWIFHFKANYELSH